MKQSHIAGIAALIALVLGTVMAIYIAPPQTEATEYLQRYPEPRALPDFTLTDQHGQPFTPENLSGHWTLAFMGYTYCPDICPTTLAELKRIYPALEQIESDTPAQVVLISVDPNRDKPARLKEYIEFFNPDFIAVTAEHAQLYPLVRAMGMMYSISDDITKPDYLVDHSASVVVINPDGNVIGRFKPQHGPGQLAVSDGEQIKQDMPILMTM